VRFGAPARERQQSDYGGDADDDRQDDFYWREMAGQDVGQMQKKQPGQDHDDEPAEEAGKSHPFSQIAVTKSEHDSRPERQRLHYVTQDSVAYYPNHIEGQHDDEAAKSDQASRVAHGG
jgi:hypothetical protein